MPRKPRIYVAGLPVHVIQRGNNRSVCFYSDEDYRVFLDYLDDACKRYGVALHAYVLMTNHSHLLMTPSCKDGISKVMQSLGRQYVQFINKRLRRSGTLWEGRYKANVVDAESYLFACYRYIELNPVRASMTEHPGDYPWSSYQANAYGISNSRISPHPLYIALGVNSEERQSSYRQLFSTAMGAQLVHAIRTSVNFSLPLGNDRFKQEIEQMRGRRSDSGKKRGAVNDSSEMKCE